MRALVAVVLLLLAGCAEKIEVPGDTHALQFEWRIVTAQELKAQYMAAGQTYNEGDLLRGFAGRDLATGQLVVYTVRPQRLDDVATCTLGHEVLHLVAGDYHR